MSCTGWSLPGWHATIRMICVGCPPQPMALTVGSRLGHYDVTALIGEGGMDI